MTPSLEGWPTKAKEAPSSLEVRLALLDTNPVFSKSRGNLGSVGDQEAKPLENVQYLTRSYFRLRLSPTSRHCP